jgi:transketolase|tara:strand:+ start:1720 stop:3708 length:1989 start_codon:yes stop_codon:yes gene_type:complete
MQDQARSRNNKSILMADAIRFLSMDAVQAANSGHPGMPMGMADVATVLFSKCINVFPDDSDWPDRDRFVLSAGHGSMLLYALHYLLGYKDMPIENIKNFRQLNSNTAGHPELGHAKGIETTTGPLGQGLATAVGMALAERLLASKFGTNLVDHYTYVIAGDGCLQEGISHEAIEFSGHLKLSKLVVLWDDNNVSIDGSTNLSNSANQIQRFKAAGWHTQVIDGHNHQEIEEAINNAKKSRKPSLIACKTTIGYGAPNIAGTSKTHGAPLGEDEIKATRVALDWTSPAFEVPENILKSWKETIVRSKHVYDEWKIRFEKSPKRKRFQNFIDGEIPKSYEKKIALFIKEMKASQPKLATRQSSQKTLEIINQVVPNTIGGSADLTGSNLTKTNNMKTVSPGKFSGNYIHYGIREHAMGSIMNGIALHKGFIPYGGTFLVFSDYMRASIRLSALMSQRIIYVLTHDSIGLGEDGPTHQPVEHLAILRSTPNLNVIRPADMVETAEAWDIALKTNGPTVLALSRQGLKAFRSEKSSDNKVSKGGYILNSISSKRDLTLIATGSEVEIAMEAADTLKEEGLNVAVVTMPCWELFDQQDETYRKEILGDCPRIAIEAACEMGWSKYTGDKGAFIGMKGFGASGPAPELYKHFGITSKAVVNKARAILK